MEVNLRRRRRRSIARVTLETVVTETACCSSGASRKTAAAGSSNSTYVNECSSMNIGIDLGTTNSALAYIDPAEAENADFPPIHILEIPQHVRQNAVEPQRTLPSFLYLGDDQTYTGVYAREQGALVPTKTVHSAKSWLSNPDVDRTAKILPWDAQEAGRVLSPVEVSAQYLQHFREAWESRKGEPLSAQHVVLTVPASFDEEARELTVRRRRKPELKI